MGAPILSGVAWVGARGVVSHTNPVVPAGGSYKKVVMADSVTVIGGIVIPSTSPLFLACIAVHVAAALACLASGAIAMLSKKGRGRHSTFGGAYYWCLAVVCGSAAILSIVRWAEDRVLFALAVVSFAAANLGRAAIRGRWMPTARLHFVGMGLSYIVLLTAFYVDNGKNLPLWDRLPAIAYWLVPSVIGLPIMAWALLRHPLARRRDGISN